MTLILPLSNIFVKNILLESRGDFLAIFGLKLPLQSFSFIDMGFIFQ